MPGRKRDPDGHGRGHAIPSVTAVVVAIRPCRAPGESFSAAWWEDTSRHHIICIAPLSSVSLDVRLTCGGFHPGSVETRYRILFRSSQVTSHVLVLRSAELADSGAPDLMGPAGAAVSLR